MKSLKHDNVQILCLKTSVSDLQKGCNSLNKIFLRSRSYSDSRNNLIRGTCENVMPYMDKMISEENKEYISVIKATGTTHNENMWIKYK